MFLLPLTKQRWPLLSPPSATKKKKEKKTGLCGHTFALAGVALFTSFADSLNFQFALVITDKGARRLHVRNATRIIAAAN